MGLSASSNGARLNWHARVWSLAWPIMLANLSVPMLGAVDTAVVGHLDHAYNIGAVALGATIFNFLFWGFGFLRMATGGFTAQAFGAGDFDELRAVLGRALMLAAVFGGLLIVVQGPAMALAFYLIEASAEVEALTQSYFVIRIWSAPATLANYAILGWFIGCQNTRVVLVLQLFMNGLNIVLDLLFVPVFGWGVPGVAWATLIAEAAAAGLGLFLVLGVLRRTGGRFQRAHLFDRGRLARMLAVNRDIFIRTLCLIFAFSYFTARGAAIGDLVLAANAVLMTFLQFQAFGLDGFAHATEALVGKAVGARDSGALSRAVRASTLWAGIVAVGLGAVVWLFGGSLAALITDQADVLETVARYRLWLAAAPVVAVWAYQLDGIFIGATRGREMRDGALISVAVYLAAMWALPAMFGNHGLWLALMVWMLARALTLAVYYPRVRGEARAPA